MAASRRRGTGTNQEAVRRHNLATLLGHVHHSGGVSRAQLTERMGLNRSTIGDLVRELDELAVVHQSAPEVSGTRAGAGRPSLDVNPDPDSVHVLAAELGVDPAACVVIGDIGADVEAARAAGARGILVPTPRTRREEVADAGEVAPDIATAVDMVLA